MSEFAESELDRSTALAWSAFRGRLADHVAAMQDDEVLPRRGGVAGRDG